MVSAFSLALVSVLATLSNGLWPGSISQIYPSFPQVAVSESVFFFFNHRNQKQARTVNMQNNRVLHEIFILDVILIAHFIPLLFFFVPSTVLPFSLQIVLLHVRENIYGLSLSRITFSFPLSQPSLSRESLFCFHGMCATRKRKHVYSSRAYFT